MIQIKNTDLIYVYFPESQKTQYCYAAFSSKRLELPETRTLKTIEKILVLERETEIILVLYCIP